MEASQPSQTGDKEQTTSSSTTSVSTNHKKNESSLKARLQSSGSQRVKDTGLMSAMSSLKTTIKLQNKIINNLLEAIDHLSLVKEKSKSPQVREVVEAVVRKAEKLNTNRASLHGAFYEAEKAGARAMADHKPTDPQSDLSAKSQDNQEDINALKSTHPAPVTTYASKVGNQFFPLISTDHTEELPP